ncbi:MAG: ABC transporter ATP-binding protein [Pirellulaceae bacterium]|nr:ABC transporter ATP-binding protein [Pirellulaceae bacterium]
MSLASRPTEPLLQLAGVQKHYADGDVHALRSIDLSIQAGQFITIVGPSGCGKSTLLHILGALDRPTQGRVLFRGQDMYSRNLNQLRSQEIGFVFQSFYLLPNLTALENVQLPMFGRSVSATQRIEQARKLLELVGLEQRLDHLPNQLSIGQRQRVAIARAMVNQPSLLLADEPTGSLDSNSGREVIELLMELNRQHGTTLVIVTHDPDIAGQGGRMIRMLDGTIVQDALAASV